MQCIIALYMKKYQMRQETRVDNNKKNKFDNKSTFDRE